MRRPLRCALSAAFLALFFMAGPRLARADGNSARDARALDLFEKSEVAYDGGRFAEAAALLKESYELKKEPVLLYNLGRAYEGLGDLAGATQSYEAFLRAEPTTPDRVGLERRIVTLRRQLAEQAAFRKQVMDRNRPAPIAPRSPSPVPWVVAGLGLAGLVAGGVAGVLAQQRVSNAKNEPTYLTADRLHSQAESLATVSTVCFIAGGVVLAGGVIWGLLDLKAARSSGSAADLTSLTTFAF